MKRKLLTSSYLSALCLEISLFLRAGISMSDGFYMLKEDDGDKASRELIGFLRDQTEKGLPLSEALNAAGGFPSYLLDMIALAEKTGELENTTRGLSEYYDRQRRLSLNIRNAVFFPAVLIAIMMTVVTVLITQVLPIFNAVFNQMGARMSTFALSLMSAGQALSDASKVIAVVVAVVLFAALLVFFIPALRTAFSRFIKDAFGGVGVLKRISSARFSFAMAMAAASGIGADEALALAARVCDGGKVFAAKVEGCRALLGEGARLGDALSGSGIFAARHSRMLSLAERTGTLPETLEIIARRNEEAIRDEIDGLIGKVEPALVIFTSVIVGIILLSVMLPLVGIMSSIR